MSPQILRDDVVGIIISPSVRDIMLSNGKFSIIQEDELDAVMGEIVRLQSGYIRQLSPQTYMWTREDK